MKYIKMGGEIEELKVQNNSPDQGLADVNNAKHLCPFLREIYHATYKVDSAKATGYKRGSEPWLCLSQQENIKEATAPVKKNEEEQEAGHTIHCGQEAQ
jgi:hypothetical protein